MGLVVDRALAGCGVAVLILIGLTHEAHVVRKLVAIPHAALHFVALIGLLRLFERWFDRPWAFVFVALAGSVAGGLILGLYLFLADKVSINTSELFAAQRLETFKCFLRIKVASTGDLTVHSIGVDRVFHRWRLLPEEPNRPLLAPVGDTAAISLHLIEPPIVIGRNPGQAGVLP